ncbi:hypothetical protein PAF15_06945 [Weissella koreensis]|uniref:hypothetical protein n=1 Tax=Weissella koreensis TaxID=165096 RepID=UPI00026F339B|nr:hypothetical protein [Weissella koreensis]EJF33292.1 hypothetical protein JC2156_10430 [Weissella koreensis KCTC 3621]MCZ9311673.1 hypothetical protein [Weissella koreensis]
MAEHTKAFYKAHKNDPKWAPEYKKFRQKQMDTFASRLLVSLVVLDLILAVISIIK